MNKSSVKAFKLFSVTYNNPSDIKPQDKGGDLRWNGAIGQLTG